MTDKYILAIDQGTTSSRAILFTQDGEILDVAQKELPQLYPKKGWVEQKAEDIWNDTLSTCRTVLKNNPEQAAQIASLGITNQRETTILWDRKTGKPVYNAIVWQDRRTAAMCKELKDAGHEYKITHKTGLLLDPYFSATKIAWILDHIPGVRHRAEAGDLAFGTVECWLLWKLTGGKEHATDATNAARTMLYNIQTQKWDDELLKLFNIPKSLLPDVKDNVADFGKTAKDIFEKPLTIGGMAGDQHAALIGQACFEPGMVKSTYGTGCFALMNIGKSFKTSENRLLTTPAYRINGEMTYAAEGSIFIAGAAIQWLRDNLGIIQHATESEALALSVEDSNGVYFVPAFTGLGAPYWEPDARAAILGLTRESNAAHITRAALEAQAYQTQDLISAMEADSGEKPAVIRADGGLVANDFMCRFLAGMLDIPVEIPHIHETTALGAAYLAGLHAGLYQGLDDIQAAWRQDRRFEPDMTDSVRTTHYQGWKEAVHAVQALAKS